MRGNRIQSLSNSSTENAYRYFVRKCAHARTQALRTTPIETYTLLKAQKQRQHKYIQLLFGSHPSGPLFQTSLNSFVCGSSYCLYVLFDINFRSIASFFLFFFVILLFSVFDSSTFVDYALLFQQQQQQQHQCSCLVMYISLPFFCSVHSFRTLFWLLLTFSIILFVAVVAVVDSSLSLGAHTHVHIFCIVSVVIETNKCHLQRSECVNVYTFICFMFSLQSRFVSSYPNTNFLNEKLFVFLHLRFMCIFVLSPYSYRFRVYFRTISK